ncbi:Gldg family protein [Haliangium ochraceum]|uniref:ABC-type uncharacterized transport system n=1 Tax=Haliangium ochraceum (strain DSM 14365 / JCM 11303 / SMP-2) TaxID=502025 RepID=D0LL58_HALO1|nr:Gldg family protein [Haliangium ochraceum]ACY18554.1 ABC-type uncharacterized transport system [Haliangium ochraceum DSM 14365]
MAMRTASPWWLSALFAVGLAGLLVGERALPHLELVRVLCSGGGMFLVLLVTGLRLFTTLNTRGDRRRVERALLWCQLGVLGALLLYLLTSDFGRGLVGADALTGDALERYLVPLQVLWAVAMGVSLVPMLMIELSLGTARRTRLSLRDIRSSEVAQEAVEAFRVRESGAAGLSVAFAAALLMVTCNVAEQRNIRRDLSYFKTSSPGESTIRIAQSPPAAVRVMMFLPAVSTVKSEVRGYMESLVAAGGRIQLEDHDLYASAEEAKDFRVSSEGTIVFAHDGKVEKIHLTVDPANAGDLAARSQLREFDSMVNRALLKVVRPRRKAYITAGHGEMSDEENRWGHSGGPEITLLESALSALNYTVEPLGLMDGLGDGVPDDASLVLVLAPRAPLTDAELVALDEYLDGGGKLLFVLDPDSQASLGVLESRLGVRFLPEPITDDRSFVPRARNPTDHRIIRTDRVSSHASVSSIASGVGRGMLFIESGSLEPVDLSRKDGTRREFTVRSSQQAFADMNDNYMFDGLSEKRQMYPLVAAIERRASVATAAPAPAGGAEAEDDPEAASERARARLLAEAEASASSMRALVFSDADIFLDIHQSQWPRISLLIADSLKWLGGEEYLAGEIESERDVLIEHARSEDALWFYATLVGAPLLVLGFGVWFGWWRRQRTQRRPS